MKLQFLKFVALIPLVTGCATTTIPMDYQVEDSRNSFDRTMMLSEVTPIVPAYIEFPYEVCGADFLKESSKRGELQADLTRPFSKRVYVVGDTKCVGR